MDNHMDNNPNGNRPDNNKRSGQTGPEQESSVDTGLSGMPPGNSGMFRHVYQYAQG